ncbi:hypothetical protein [Agromyces larvae]|uniref:Uncharacterized protein n=1 Tax=Agromyces larvae TaxID=2929802 RepID=A0ABY4C3P5_9MICO|nr:hypothetical protein [Agromyces larvae]UOE45978.1 hypothetical protein MTO99_09615 [Agromyces larvae]
MSTVTDLQRQSVISEIDRQILQLQVSGVTPEEMSRRLRGTVSPARIILRLHELANSGDYLTALQQKRLDILFIREMLGELRSRYLDVDHAKVILSLIKEVMAQEDKMLATTEHDLNTYNEAIGQQLGRVVDSSLAYMKGALREKVDPELWDSLIVEAMQHAQAEILRHQIEA